jgi:hypothetical protein
MRLACKLSICALLVAHVLPGCDDERTCTLMGCDAPLTIVLAGANGAPLPSSIYEIAMVIDDQPGSFVCGDSPELGGWFCEEPEGFAGFEVQAMPDQSEPTTIAIQIVRHDDGDELGPESVEIDIIAADAPLVDTSFTPEYETFEPNGPGCGRCDEPVVERIEIDL